MSFPPPADDSACKLPPGLMVPLIDRDRCEGKAACVGVCPRRVFTLGVLPPAERAGLSLRGKVKGLVHGWKQAFTPNASACEACGRCVEACPEGAIRLVRAQPGPGNPA
jgi:NAD-dependent dihydropyrimidine dehydrogenase PreA subunit